MGRQFSLSLVLFALVGCSTGSSISDRAFPEPPRSSEKKDRTPPESPVRINRTLIYPVRHGRAEDLAITLEPILVSRYGSGVRIVPQAATNKLMIYLPPREEQEASLRQQSGPARRPARSARAPGGRLQVR
jgi:hypothetical protein